MYSGTTSDLYIDSRDFYIKLKSAYFEPGLRSTERSWTIL